MKLTLDEMRVVAEEVDGDLGSVCNDVYDAIEGEPRGPRLQEIIDRGWAKVRQYESAVVRMTDEQAAGFRADCEHRIAGLREDLAVLEKKQKGG